MQIFSDNVRVAVISRRTKLTTIAFCAGDTRQQTTVSHCVDSARNSGFRSLLNACRNVSPSMTTANAAWAPGTNPRRLGSKDGGPSTEAILFKPPSICRRVASGESAERIMMSMSLLSKLQLKPVATRTFSELILARDATELGIYRSR